MGFCSVYLFFTLFRTKPGIKYWFVYHLPDVYFLFFSSGGKAVNLQTKEERDQWEKHFTVKFIAPAVKVYTFFCFVL